MWGLVPPSVACLLLSFLSAPPILLVSPRSNSFLSLYKTLTAAVSGVRAGWDWGVSCVLCLCFFASHGEEFGQSRTKACSLVKISYSTPPHFHVSAKLDAGTNDRLAVPREWLNTMLLSCRRRRPASSFSFTTLAGHFASRRSLTELHCTRGTKYPALLLHPP